MDPRRRGPIVFVSTYAREAIGIEYAIPIRPMWPIIVNPRQPHHLARFQGMAGQPGLIVLDPWNLIAAGEELSMRLRAEFFNRAPIVVGDDLVRMVLQLPNDWHVDLTDQLSAAIERADGRPWVCRSPAGYVMPIEAALRGLGLLPAEKEQADG